MWSTRLRAVFACCANLPHSTPSAESTRLSAFVALLPVYALIYALRQLKLKVENGKLEVADELYIISNPLSLVLYARISIAVYGKYRAALRHIDCAVGTNIERAPRA